MAKKTKLLFFLILFSFFLSNPKTVEAVPPIPVWSKACTDANDVATLQGFECIYKNLLRSLIPLGGLAAFVVILLGGFQYITSAGDPKQAQKASSMITGAIIGLVVAVGIWFLFQILNGITGLDLLRFAIPGP